MAAYQFDVIHSASRLVRGRLLVERMEGVAGNQVQWAYVEPAESTNVRARGMGNWDSLQRNLSLTEWSPLQGRGSDWAVLGEFHEGNAKPGGLFRLYVNSSGLHRAVLTVVDDSDDCNLMALVRQGAIRPRTDSQIKLVLQRTVITPTAQPIPVRPRKVVLPASTAIGLGSRSMPGDRLGAETLSW